MESRKRQHSEEEDTKVIKKRILSDSAGSPRVNGSYNQSEHLEEPTDSDNLELFRKEAIFRRMKHYSREYERSQVRIAELERRKSTCEAGVAAISACWVQLFETVRHLLKSEDLGSVNRDVLDLTAHMQDDNYPAAFDKLLEDNMNATQTLVNELVSLHAGSQEAAALQLSQNASIECMSLRSEVASMRLKLQDAESQRDEYHNALVTAENRLERIKSKTVAAMESRVEKAKEEPKEEPQRKPSSPVPSTQSPLAPVNANPLEVDILREQVKLRDGSITDLEKEIAALRDAKTIAESELKLMSWEKVCEHPQYTILLDHASTLEATISDARTQLARSNEELNNLKLFRQDFEEQTIAAANQGCQELRAMLSKRDAENARLRDQREQISAELTERKAKDSVKLISLQEFKTLAESRHERILALESELRRCKTLLAANAGDKELVAFLANATTDDMTYIDHLKAKLTVADSRVAAFEQSLQETSPDRAELFRTKTELLQQLSEVSAQLEKYKSVYGNPSTLSPDASSLVDQVHRKADEIAKLRLQEDQRKQEEAPLYAELERLSAAWESLDKQVKNKVFDLAALEDRLVKSSLEKAKSDNKFYATMRDKEAIDAERKNQARNCEKQAKLVDRLRDVEKNLSSQVISLEKELAAVKKVIEAYKNRAETLEADVALWKTRAETEKQRGLEIRTLTLDREKLADHKRSELKKLEDSLVRSRKEFEQKLKDAVSTNGQTDDGEIAGLLKILKCSTCQLSFRNTVITKCMHTFCKNCVDARIATRQRKCPACGLTFAQSDVQQIFFQ